MTAVDQSLDESSEWIDALLALGWRSQSAESIERAQRILQSLHDAGLDVCVEALSRTVESLRRRDAQHISDCIGRLCATLEFAREVRRFDRLSDSATGKANR